MSSYPIGWKEKFETEALVKGAITDILAELEKAMGNFAPMNSAHEGFAVLAEEVDELWGHVKTNQGKRDIAAMRKECIQIAAMAVRFAVEVCNEKVGRK